MSRRESQMLKALALPIIGRIEEVSLPLLNVKKIHAKVDSGAKTSALHAEEVEFFRKGRKKMVRFRISPDKKGKLPWAQVTAVVIGERWVKSSLGFSTLRPVIKTTLQLGTDSWPIEITLVNRDLMGYRMLLGREAIKERFLIDVSKTYLQRKKLKTRN